jgi:hypothetical protein
MEFFCSRIIQVDAEYSNPVEIIITGALRQSKPELTARRWRHRRKYNEGLEM